MPREGAAFGIYAIDARGDRADKRGRLWVRIRDRVPPQNVPPIISEEESGGGSNTETKGGAAGFTDQIATIYISMPYNVWRNQHQRL